SLWSHPDLHLHQFCPKSKAMATRVLPVPVEWQSILRQTGQERKVIGFANIRYMQNTFLTVIFMAVNDEIAWICIS
ncbi:MAG: hypothetical protein WCR46_21865, partial [Deltaproteobacteria bacterium]